MIAAIQTRTETLRTAIMLLLMSLILSSRSCEAVKQRLEWTLQPDSKPNLRLKAHAQQSQRNVKGGRDLYCPSTANHTQWTRQPTLMITSPLLNNWTDWLEPITIGHLSSNWLMSADIPISVIDSSSYGFLGLTFCPFYTPPTVRGLKEIKV